MLASTLSMIPLTNDAKASTMYVESYTPYTVNSTEDLEYRRGYEYLFTKLCEDRKYGKQNFFHYAVKVNSINISTPNLPFVYTISQNSIQFTNTEKSKLIFNARCR